MPIAVTRSRQRIIPLNPARGGRLRWLCGAVGVVLNTACAEPKTTSTCERGAEACPCFGNGTCNAGLTCLSNFCVDTEVDASGDTSSVQGADAAPPDSEDASFVADGSGSDSAPEDTSHGTQDAAEPTGTLSSTVHTSAPQGSTASGPDGSTSEPATTSPLASTVPSTGVSGLPSSEPSASVTGAPSASTMPSASSANEPDSGAPCIETGSFPFVETFECSAGFWTHTGGTWAVTDADTQVYEQSAQSNVEVFAVPVGFTPRSDLRIEARIRVLELNTSDPFARAGIYLRMQSADQYVGAVWTEAGRLALRTATSGGGSSEGSDGNQPLLTLGEWYNIGIAASGDRIEVLRDGQIVGTSTSNAVVNGQIALAARNAVVQFDDVMVGPY